jgi:carbamate kinase
MMERNKLAVIAIGGNSLISETEEVNVASEYKIVGETCRQIAQLMEDGWNVVITHGNGPQAGWNLRRSELASHELFELPMDVIVTFTQGSIGYYIQQNLTNIFAKSDPHRKIATIVTQIEVDPKDKAFDNPTKSIGGYLTEEQARKMEASGWPTAEEPGKGWRRLVASPAPLRIIELEIIRDLLARDHIVVACGGGGVAVAKSDLGHLEGVPAIIDKDLSSALLASELNAQLLIISTAVERVALNFGKENETWLDQISLDQARAYQDEGHFGVGSMAPKVNAAMTFIEKGGASVIITNPQNIYKSATGEAGTHIRR